MSEAWRTVWRQFKVSDALLFQAAIQRSNIALYVFLCIVHISVWAAGRVSTTAC